MLLLLRFVFVVLFICNVTSCKQKNQTEIVPLEVFFKDPEQSGFQISPNGKYISYVKPDKDGLNIYVKSLQTQKETRVSSEKGKSILYHFWGNNQKILYLKDPNASRKYVLGIVNRDGKDVKFLNDFEGCRFDMVDRLEDDDDHILVAVNKIDPSVFDVYRLSLQTGDAKLMVKNPGNIVSWITNKKGEVKLAVSSDGINETLLYRNNSAEKFEPVITNNFKNTLRPISFSNNEQEIFAISNVNRDRSALVRINCKTGKELGVIYENKKSDVVDVAYSKNRNELDYAVVEREKRENYLLNNRMKAIFTDLKKSLPGKEIRITDRDDNETLFLIRTFTDINPGNYYLYQANKHKLYFLGNVNKAIKEEQMCKMEPVNYKTKDGYSISGYLTYPKNKKRNNLPVVVLPHSNVSSRTSWGYNAEVQFLANRGYLVFQMNYRGSRGYGKTFSNAGNKEWGRKIQNDITEGTQWLIAKNIADKNKIAIYGYNFGGYSAFNGVINNPTLYRCAVSYSGIINLFSYLKGLPAYYKPFKLMFDEMIGNPEKDGDYLKQSSPVFNADKIKVPILIAQGAKDPTVNITETNQFVKELKKRGVPVTYYVKEDEGHAFRIAKNRIDFYKNLELFLANHLNPNE